MKKNVVGPGRKTFGPCAAIAVFALVFAALWACSGTAAALGSAQPDARLRGTRWILGSVGEKSVADFPKTAKEAFIFFQAEGNRLFGSGGVNNLMSGFTEGDGGSLEILPAAATLMMGPNMELETEFFRRLASVSAYAVHGDELTLSDAGGSAALRFTALSPARVAGTYRGVLPCANCEGIETEVILTAGGEYTRTLRYRGKPGEPQKEEGTFSLNHLDNALVLDNVDNGKEPAFYGIAPGSLIQLDLEGKPITGNLAGLYELKRQ